MKARFLASALLVIAVSQAGAQTSGSVWDYCGASDQPVRIESCSTIIASSSSTADIVSARAVRGTVYLRNGEFDKAITDFSEALNLHPADKTSTELLLTGRGIAYIYKHQPDEAIASLTQATQLNPDNATALETLGNAYTLKADYRDAVASFDKSLKLKPNAIVRTNRAYALLKLKRYREALADYTLALKDDGPAKAKALFGKGLAEQALGDTQDAARDMAAARKLDPDIAKTFE